MFSAKRQNLLKESSLSSLNNSQSYVHKSWLLQIVNVNEPTCRQHTVIEDEQTISERSDNVVADCYAYG